MIDSSPFQVDQNDTMQEPSKYSAINSDPFANDLFGNDAGHQDEQTGQDLPYAPSKKEWEVINAWQKFVGFRHAFNQANGIFTEPQAKEAIKLISEPCLKFRNDKPNSFKSEIKDLIHKWGIMRMIAIAIDNEKKDPYMREIKGPDFHDVLNGGGLTTLMRTSTMPYEKDDNRTCEQSHDAIMAGFLLGDYIERDFSDTAIHDITHDYSVLDDKEGYATFYATIHEEFKELGYMKNYSFRPYKAHYMMRLEQHIMEGHHDATPTSYIKEVTEELYRLSTLHTEEKVPFSDRALNICPLLGQGK